MENTTRISDLPENITTETQENNAFQMHSQMNIHPNPYMAPQQQQQQQPPMEMPRMPKQLPVEMQHQMNQHQIQHQRLPSRDIPMDQTQYTQDVQITANYIPPASSGARLQPQANVMSDYVRERETLTNEKLRQYEEKKSRLDKIDQLLIEFQTPVFIMLLFFLFQLPVVNVMIFKKFSFLSIVNDDGNFNTFGLACKSFLFGSLFYSVTKFTNYIIEL